MDSVQLAGRSPGRSDGVHQPGWHEVAGDQPLEAASLAADAHAAVLEIVTEDPTKNEREALLEEAKKVLAELG